MELAPRHIRWLSWIAAGVIVTAGAGVIGWGVHWQPPTWTEDVSNAGRQPTTQPSRTTVFPLITVASGLELRRPLFDPPPKPPDPPPPPPPLSLKLLGTVIEGEQARAIVQDGNGKSEFKRVGDRCGQAEILVIQANSIVVRYLGKEQTLAVDRPGGRP